MLSRKEWKRRFPGIYNSKKHYMDYKRMLTNDYDLAPTPCTSTPPESVLHSDGSYYPVPCPPPFKETAIKGNNPMFDCECDSYAIKKTACRTQAATPTPLIVQVSSDSKPTTEQEQRKFLLQRAYDARWSKLNALADQFFIHEPAGPKTAQELVDRLKAGLYTVDLKVEDDIDENCFYWRDAFSWRTPTTQKDKKGYDAALKAFSKFYEDVVNTINIVSPIDGLAALNTIKDWKTA